MEHIGAGIVGIVLFLCGVMIYFMICMKRDERDHFVRKVCHAEKYSFQNLLAGVLDYREIIRRLLDEVIHTDEKTLSRIGIKPRHIRKIRKEGAKKIIREAGEMLQRGPWASPALHAYLLKTGVKIGDPDDVHLSEAHAQFIIKLAKEVAKDQHLRLDPKIYSDEALKKILRRSFEGDQEGRKLKAKFAR